jgi:hypothetical protein
MWPTSYAITAITKADEKRITDLVKRAVSDPRNGVEAVTGSQRSRRPPAGRCSATGSRAGPAPSRTRRTWPNRRRGSTRAVVPAGRVHAADETLAVRGVEAAPRRHQIARGVACGGRRSRDPARPPSSATRLFGCGSPCSHSGGPGQTGAASAASHTLSSRSAGPCHARILARTTGSGRRCRRLNGFAVHCRCRAVQGEQRVGRPRSVHAPRAERRPRPCSAIQREIQGRGRRSARPRRAPVRTASGATTSAATGPPG